MLIRPFSRLVVAFGRRLVTPRKLIEEVVVGLLLMVPLGICMGNMTIGICVKANPFPKFIRADVWTTLVVFLVGDAFMECLLPSVKCLPLEGEIDYGWIWLLQTFGMACGRYSHYDPITSTVTATYLATNGCDDDDLYQNPETAALLTPEATALIFTVRLIFLCCGVYLGESFFPIALTGGIACGKSTVAQLLTQHNDRLAASTAAPTTGSTTTTKSYTPPTHSKTMTTTAKTNPATAAIKTNSSIMNGPNSRTPSPIVKRGRKRGGGVGGGSSSSGGLVGGNPNHPPPSLRSTIISEEKEGTVELICADSIAHEILLPPQMLARGNYTVAPRDSVYPLVVQKFGQYDIFQTNGDEREHHDDDDDDDGDENNSILDHDDDDDQGQNKTNRMKCIDRRKLGALVFQDATLRRMLNKITHPRILMILLQRIISALYFSKRDLVIADVPLLFESGKLRWLFGLTICVVISDPDVQLERLQDRNPDISKQECQARINSQLSLDKKRKLADFVIENDGSLQDLQEKVEQVRNEIMLRMYGIGMSLLQMLMLIGGSTSIAISCKFYTSQP